MWMRSPPSAHPSPAMTSKWETKLRRLHSRQHRSQPADPGGLYSRPFFPHRQPLAYNSQSFLRAGFRQLSPTAFGESFTTKLAHDNPPLATCLSCDIALRSVVENTSP